MKSASGDQTWVRKTYAAFEGCLFSDLSCLKRVKDRDPSKLKIPKCARSFQFFDVVSTTVVVDGREMELKSEQINHSPKYHCAGRVYTIPMLRRSTMPNKSALLSNMRTFGVKRAIRYPNGGWGFIEKGDVVIKNAA